MALLFVLFALLLALSVELAKDRPGGRFGIRRLAAQ
jgi:hypothetical protein